MADLNIQGAAELDRVLQQLPANIERNILRGALRAGAKVLEREAKANVPFKSGKLRASIRVSMRVRAGLVIARVIAGGRQKGDAFYAHMVEGGTKAHEETLSRWAGFKAFHFGSKFFSGVLHHRGSIAQPFMKPAFDNKAQSAVDRIAEYIRGRLDKEAKS